MVYICGQCGQTPVRAHDVRCWRRRADAVGAFDLRSSRESTECQVVRAPDRASSSARVHAHTLATDPLRQSLLVRNRHDTLRSVNKLAVKMYNDNHGALRRRVEDQNFSFSHHGHSSSEPSSH